MHKKSANTLRLGLAAVCSAVVIAAFQNFSSTPPASSLNGTISYTAFGSDGYTHVYLTTSDGKITQLTSGSHTDGTPEWSPDGSKLVFGRFDSAGSAVYTMNADGTNLTRLSPSPGRDSLPSFSPDGTKIVFTYTVTLNSCNGTLPTTNIMIMNSDGSGRTTLIDSTHAATCFNGAPRISPDGTKIAYMCAPYNNGGQVCRINTDASGFMFLTNTAYNVFGDPHWSWWNIH